MAEEAVRAVLERLLLLLPPPSSTPRRGSLLVALVAPGGPLCTVTVAAAGGLSRDVGAESLRGAARGVQELPGVPCAPPPCCARILRRARLRLAFQLRPPPGSLVPDCVSLRRFLHKTSVGHPEVEFHFCVSLDGAEASYTYGRESSWAQGGARLRVQSRHFAPPAALGGAPPPCSRIHPTSGPPIGLRVPPPAAAQGLGGDLSLVPAAALGPCLRPPPPPRLCAVALFLYDPAGLPGPPPRPPPDPSWLADWGRFGLVATPRDPPGGDEGLVTPDVTYALRRRGGAPEGGDGPPQTLLIFLFLRHQDPFQEYDAGTRRLLLAHLAQTLWTSGPALARGLRTLVHPILGELRRQHESQERLARSVPVVVAAVTTVVASSTNARFRQACLRAMQVEDTPALAVATRRSLAVATQRRLRGSGSCETPGDPRRGSPSEGPREEEEEEEEVWRREVAALAQWPA